MGLCFHILIVDVEVSFEYDRKLMTVTAKNAIMSTPFSVLSIFISGQLN